MTFLGRSAARLTALLTLVLAVLTPVVVGAQGAPSDGGSSGKTELQPVVLRRVVGSGHDDAGEVHEARDVVERIGRDLAEIRNIDAGVVDPVDEGTSDRW